MKFNWHNIVSFVKSIFRVAAGFALIRSDLISAGILLIIAEVLGVIEEI